MKIAAVFTTFVLVNIFAKTYNITSAQMDADFRLSAVGIAQLFQDCFASYMAYYHCAAFDLRQIGKMWIISDFTFQVAPPIPLWGEKLDIELWLSASPQVKVCCDYQFKHNGTVAVKGTSTWAILDIVTRKPQIAKNILAQMEVFPQRALSGLRQQYAVPSDGCLHYTHQTNSSDTDFNSHISNLTYMRVAIDSLPVDYVRTRPIQGASFKFMHESFLGDRLESIFMADATTPDLWRFSIGRDPQTQCCCATLQFGQAEDSASTFGNDCEIRKLREK